MMQTVEKVFLKGLDSFDNDKREIGNTQCCTAGSLGHGITLNNAGKRFSAVSAGVCKDRSRSNAGSRTRSNVTVPAR